MAHTSHHQHYCHIFTFLLLHQDLPVNRALQKSTMPMSPRRYRGGMLQLGSRVGIFLVCASALTVHTSAFSRVERNHIIVVEGSEDIPFIHHRGRMTYFGKSPSLVSATPTSTALALRGGEVSEIVTSAYDWCTNLGNPSALVAGAVVATMYENIGSGDLEIEEQDTKVVRFGKRLTRVLLLSAFALEVMSIFVCTVTGTMLLSKTEDDLDALVSVTKNTTPLSFLHDNFEFEYLTARITFLQGLLNWIFAIALTHILPNGESREIRAMNKFISSSLVLTVLLMLAFYNRHLDFYGNYFLMVSRWVHVMLKKFVYVWPPRPSMLLTIPCLIKTIMLGYEAFVSVDNQKVVPPSHKDDKQPVTTAEVISQ
eukprot:scaffold1793_cov173-Amphora_coffeaeformis.AAC.20